jgi:hypothetical protein
MPSPANRRFYAVQLLASGTSDEKRLAALGYFDEALMFYIWAAHFDSGQPSRRTAFHLRGPIANGPDKLTANDPASIKLACIWITRLDHRRGRPAQ